MSERKVKVNVRLYADDVRDAKVIARADGHGRLWHPTLRELVRLGLEERRRRDAERGVKPPPKVV